MSHFCSKYDSHDSLDICVKTPLSAELVEQAVDDTAPINVYLELEEVFSISGAP